MRKIVEPNHIPLAGKYQDKIVVDPVNGVVYLYDCEGTYTEIVSQEQSGDFLRKEGDVLADNYMYGPLKIVMPRFVSPSGTPVPETNLKGQVYMVDANDVLHLSFFVSILGNGETIDDKDYDADVYSKDRMYLGAGSGIDLRPNLTPGAPEQGRVRFIAENGINYIQSGRNFSGTLENSLAITKMSSSFNWLFFDVAQSGRAGFGLPNTELPIARLHVEDSALSTVGFFKSTGSSISRIGFAGFGGVTPTSSTSQVMIGAQGDSLVGRGGGVDVLEVTGAAVRPLTNNNRTLGDATHIWSHAFIGALTLTSTGTTAVTANYAVATTIHTVFADTTAGVFTVTLPSAVTYKDRVITIKREDVSSNDLTVAASAGNVDGAATYALTGSTRVSARFQSDGANWWKFN
jgi:hypothetical protein